MNSFAAFTLVGESATLAEYKEERLLMQATRRAQARSATPSTSSLTSCSPVCASRPRAQEHPVL